MTTQIMIKKQNIVLENITKELKDIKKQLKKFIFFIPEESIEEYKNASEIKKAYLRTRKSS